MSGEQPKRDLELEAKALVGKYVDNLMADLGYRLGRFLNGHGGDHDQFYRMQAALHVLTCLHIRHVSNSSKAGIMYSRILKIENGGRAAVAESLESELMKQRILNAGRR